MSRQQISYLCKAGILKAHKIHARLYLITRASLAAYHHAERRKHGPYATSLKLRSPERRAKNPGKKSKPAHITIDT